MRVTLSEGLAEPAVSPTPLHLVANTANLPTMLVAGLPRVSIEELRKVQRSEAERNLAFGGTTFQRVIYHTSCMPDGRESHASDALKQTAMVGYVRTRTVYAVHCRSPREIGRLQCPSTPHAVSSFYHPIASNKLVLYMSYILLISIRYTGVISSRAPKVV